VSSTPAEYFRQLYAGDADPWRLRERWYEQRKRNLLLAALPQPRYARAFEPGCATGALTELLARRCDLLVAAEAEPAPLEQAGNALADLGGVTLVRGRIPGWWPDGDFDLVVLSELLYYFAPADLDAVLDRAVASLRPGGTLAAVHWRHPAPDHAQSGDAVHDRLHRRRDLRGLSALVEDDFRLDVLVRAPAGTPALSVAARTGIPGARPDRP
jgi:trans-aconitate methyltransferase